MGASFKFVVFAGIAVEVKDLLTIFRHNASLSETAVSFDMAFGLPWPSAEAVPDDPASATSYSAPENVRVLPVIETKRELIQGTGAGTSC
jgi:hypothetical protein